MWAQAGGIYLFIHPNVHGLRVPVRVMVASKVDQVLFCFFSTEQLSPAIPGVQDLQVM